MNRRLLVVGALLGLTVAALHRLVLAAFLRLTMTTLHRLVVAAFPRGGKAMQGEKYLPTRVGLIVACIAYLAGAETHAQNFSSSGQNWSSGWGFPSPSDRSLSLQQAQAIRLAERTAGPSSVVTTYNEFYNDNRSSYQEVIGDVLELGSIDFQLSGDRIGQNTNSIGSMNTGTTNIDVVGSNNEIIATNAAETEGCVDGSIQQETSSYHSNESPSGIDISITSDGREMACAE